MNVDLIGLENIKGYIERSRKSKFSIYRAGTNGNSLPVFECIGNTTNHEAVKDFEAWANLVNNNNPYRLVLFDIADEEGNKAKGRAGKMEANFCIVEPGTKFGSNGESAGLSLEQMREQMRKEFEAHAAQTAQELKIKELELKIEAMQAAEDDEEDDEEEEPGGLFGVLSKPDNLQAIQMIAQALRGGNLPAAPAINGTDTAEETQTMATATEQTNSAENAKRLNKAVLRLAAKDKKLTEHLEKLADIAEGKPMQFKMLLTMLEQQ